MKDCVDDSIRWHYYRSGSTMREITGKELERALLKTQGRTWDAYKGRSKWGRCYLEFYKDPEKWVTGSYIKIGFFGKSDSDLVYQDEVHGPLIEQVDKTVDLVYTKYMKA
mgnify:CR=1 FL=1